MAPRVTSERPARGGRKKEREIGKEKQTSKWHPLRERVSPTHHAREHSHSTDTAWTQHRHGTDTAQTRHRHSTDTVQTQHRHGTGTAQAQHSQSTVTATAQSPHCPYSSATTALKDPVDLNGAAGEVGGHIGISARHDRHGFNTCSGEENALRQTSYDEYYTKIALAFPAPTKVTNVVQRHFKGQSRNTTDPALRVRYAHPSWSPTVSLRCDHNTTPATERPRGPVWGRL